VSKGSNDFESARLRVVLSDYFDEPGGYPLR
jgi:hypothetical protein